MATAGAGLMDPHDLAALAVEYGVAMPEPSDQPVHLPPRPAGAPRLNGWWLGPREWEAVRKRQQQAIIVPAPAPEEGDLALVVRVTAFANPSNYWVLRRVTGTRERGPGLAVGWVLVSLAPLRTAEKREWAIWMRACAQLMLTHRLAKLTA